MVYQLSLCARRLPEEGSYIAVVTTEDGDKVGETGECPEPTTDPVWTELVTADVPDNVVLQVQVCGAEERNPIATAKFELSKDVLSSKSKAAARFSEEDGDGGSLVAVRAEPVKDGTLRLQMAAEGIPDTDSSLRLMSKDDTDPCFEMYSAITGRKLVTSEVKEDDLNPVWDPVEVSLDELCGNHRDWGIRFTLNDYDGDSEDMEYLGQCKITLEELLGESGEGTFPIAFGSLVGEEATVSGSLVVKEATILPQKKVDREDLLSLASVSNALVDSRDTIVEKIAEKEALAEEAAAAVEELQAQAEELVGEENALSATRKEARAQFYAAKEEYDELVKKAVGCSGKWVLQLKATGLYDTDFGYWNKSDPVVEMYLEKKGKGKEGKGKEDKEGKDGPLIYRSNVVEDNLNPVWDETTIDMSLLGGEGVKACLKLIVSDKDKSTSQDHLGGKKVTFEKLHSKSGPIILDFGGKATLDVVKSELVDFVDETSDFYVQQVKPVEAEHKKAAKAFDVAHKTLTKVRQQLAKAKEKATVAKRNLAAEQKALEILEGSDE